MKFPINLNGRDTSNKDISIPIEIIYRNHLRMERLNLTSIDLTPLESIENPEQISIFVAHENFLEEI